MRSQLALGRDAARALRLATAAAIVLAAAAGAFTQDRPPSGPAFGPTPAPPPPAPVTVRFRPPVGVTFVAQLEETIERSSSITRATKGELIDSHHKASVSWTIEFTAAAPQPDGNVPVSVVVVSLRGTFKGTNNGKESVRTFDSASNRPIPASEPNAELLRAALRCVGLPGMVLVSQQGDVIDPGTNFHGFTNSESADPARRQQAVAVLEKVFHSVPESPAKPLLSWGGLRYIAPYAVVTPVNLCAGVEERYRVKSMTGDSLLIDLSGAGANSHPKRKVPLDTVTGAIKRWRLTGTADIDPVIGIAKSRTSRVTATNEGVIEVLKVSTRTEHVQDITLSIARKPPPPPPAGKK